MKKLADKVINEITKEFIDRLITLRVLPKVNYTIDLYPHSKEQCHDKDYQSITEELAQSLKASNNCVTLPKEAWIEQHPHDSDEPIYVSAKEQ